MPDPTALDPDITRRDDPAYWAAALVLAIRDGDADREAVARDQLCRLGYRPDIVRADRYRPRRPRGAE